MPVRLRANRGVETLDRRRQILSLSAAWLALAACAAGPAFDIRSAAWIADGRDRADVLTLEPPACLKTTGLDNGLVQEGEALFNSPFLLGGQAAKAGLSCAACHRNGRGNPDFALGSLSAMAGHADVTDAFLGPKRADGIDNPVVIPDLADATQQKVSRDTGALVVFIDAQLTEEFEAARAAPETLSAIAAYVAAIGTESCPSALQPMTYAADLRRAESALTRSERYSGASPQAEEALRLAARASLGRLNERYPFKHQSGLRASLADLSRRIGSGEDAAGLAAELRKLESTLASEAGRSLYDAATVRRALPN